MQHLFTSQSAVIHPLGRVYPLFYCAVILLVLFFAQLPAQDLFKHEPHVIDNYLDGAIGLAIADINGDDNPDVIACGFRAHSIVWYESPYPNISGEWERHILASGLDRAYMVKAADIDGDGDNDLVASVYGGNKLVWFDNPDWNEHIIDANVAAAAGIAVVDMNGDDTLDVVATGEYTNKILWYQGPDWVPHTVDNQVDNTGGSASELIADDIDMDGDIDIIASVWHSPFDWNSGSLVLYEGPDWNKVTLDSDLGYCFGMDTGDMDGDTDLDIVATSTGKDLVVWYEQPGWNRHTITSSLNLCSSVAVEDFDNDNHLDVVAAGQETDNPLRVFYGPDWDIEPIHNANVNFRYVDTYDLDKDGDVDIIASIMGTNHVVWYEDTLIIDGIEQLPGSIPNHYTLSQNYPNPFNPSTTITFSIPKTEFVSLKVYNNLGQEVAALVTDRLTPGSYQYTWDAGSLSSGVYYYKLQAGTYIETKKLILLR